jgi:protein-disulfide isomerase
MLSRLVTVTVVALFSLSGPQSTQDELAALRKEIAELKASQAAMQRDLDVIKNFLQAVAQGRQPGEPLENASVPIAGEPARGSATAKLTLVEVSDYHCPFCRRHTQQTQPQLDAEYINSGKVRYVFVDYPITQLHPDAFKAHEAANCAGEQGKYWQMHAQLFVKPTRDPAELTAQAASAGMDAAKFRACLDSGKYRASIQESVGRMQQLGVDSTPTFLIGATPTGNAPMKVLRVVRGAQPYGTFKTALDDLLKGS